MITKFPNTISSGKILYRYLFFSYSFLAKTYQSHTQFYSKRPCFSRTQAPSQVCLDLHLHAQCRGTLDHSLKWHYKCEGLLNPLFMVSILSNQNTLWGLKGV
jgi:hypothetical protein